jgi:hypothetical protein
MLTLNLVSIKKDNPKTLYGKTRGFVFQNVRLNLDEQKNTKWLFV